MATEDKIAFGVLKIAAAHPNGLASHRRIRSELPKVVNLNAADLAPSQTRKGEQMWHQIVRNIKSHDKTPGNYIYEGLLEHVPRVGYRITAAGRLRLQAKAS